MARLILDIPDEQLYGLKMHCKSYGPHIPNAVTGINEHRPIYACWRTYISDLVAQHCDKFNRDHPRESTEMAAALIEKQEIEKKIESLGRPTVAFEEIVEDKEKK